MNGWTKYYIDGTRYVGLDTDKHRSWRNSRMDGLVRVDVEHGMGRLSIGGGPGEYWQSDDLLAASSSGSVTYQKRRIQRLLTTRCNFLGIQQECSTVSAWVTLQPPNRYDFDMFRPLTPLEIGKWLTLEYDVQKGLVFLRFADNRI